MSFYKHLFQSIAFVVCLLLLTGCGAQSERLGERENYDYTISLGRIEYTGKTISDAEIEVFLIENKSDIESTIVWSSIEPIDGPIVLNRPICMITVGERQSVLNRSFVYLPVVNRDGDLIKLMSLRRTENGLEYGIEGLGVIVEALEKYPDEDLVLVQVPSHLALCVLSPDNRIFSNASTEMFATGTNYYEHFKTDHNVINAEWYK